jgi:RNA polymerase sigma-70 factor, ECF subfamily
MTPSDLTPLDATALQAEASSTGVQDKLYAAAIAQYGPALTRLVRGYEARADRRQDLTQDIHIALWRSFALFDHRCSLRTWVYRVAHITATKHIVSTRRTRLHELHTLDDIPEPMDQRDPLRTLDQSDSLQHLLRLIDRLKPVDRQVMLLYLEECSAEEIGEIVGLSPENIATKIHRIKKLLATLFDARGGS